MTSTTAPVPVDVRPVEVGSIVLNVATAGEGPPLLLLHGWPHTWRVWERVLPRLAADHRVIAPDLRGLGASARAPEGYDLHALADDCTALLDAVGAPSASVAGIDAGVWVAFVLAMRAPERVDRLVLMEGVLPGLPGAEAFLAAGPPWWFGFHAVPGLAETVLVGHEAEYVDWFLLSGTGGRGVHPAVRDAFVAAYSGAEALRCGFEYYRGAPEKAAQVAGAVAAGRLRMPTMAIGAGAVGDALHRQLRPVSDDLVGRVIDDCGHIIPLDRPEELLDLLVPFLAAG